MFLICPLLHLIAVVSLFSVDAKVVDCSSPSNPNRFIINSLSLTPPDEVSPGNNVSLGLFYTNPTLVTDGTVTTSVTYNFLPLTPTVEPLCNSVVCPLQPGQHDGSASFAFPTGLSGTVVTKIVWTVADIQVLCLQITMRTLQNKMRLYGLF